VKKTPYLCPAEIKKCGILVQAERKSSLLEFAEAQPKKP